MGGVDGSRPAVARVARVAPLALRRGVAGRESPWGVPWDHGCPFIIIYLLLKG